MGKTTTFFLNSTLHVIILLLILSLFFFIYVSKLSSATFKNEITSILRDNFIPAIQKADTKGLLKQSLKKTDLNPWINYYKNTPEESTVIENEWLKKSTAIVLTFLIVIFFLTIALLKFDCKQDIPLFRIIRDNIILFFFVGMIEILFFYYIARKYIPVYPSTMINAIISTLKKEFN